MKDIKDNEGKNKKFFMLFMVKINEH